MTAIRVLHQVLVAADRDDDLATYAQHQRKRAGCLEAECYRSASSPERVSIVELWSDQHRFADHWSEVLGDPEPNIILRSCPDQAATEFYRHQTFELDEIWVASNHRDRRQKIYWPGTAAVRVIIQMSRANLREGVPHLLQNVRETRQEPGCLEFDLFRSVEFEEHALLVELWRDQATYDVHWKLRMSTGSAGSDSVPAPRREGTNGFEFYRLQPFVHVSDRWVSENERDRPETVLWAD